MASIYSSTNRGWQLRLDWSITGQSINDNTSTLSLDLWVYDGTGYSQNQDANEAYYIIQGEKRWNPYNYSTTGWYKLGSKSITVGHNADGTGSVTLSAEWDCGWDSAYTPRHLSLSEAVTLTTIPRASSVSISGDALGKAVAISISRASSGFTHKLYYSCGAISWAGIASDVGTSYSWTPPVSLAQQAPNASAVVGTIIVETYNGSTYIGVATAQFTLAVPNTVVPSLAVSLSDPTKVSATYGGYVQLRSKLKVDLTASGAQGSTIKAYNIKLGDIYAVAAASGTTDYLPTAGALTLTCSVTDSRGRTTTKTQTITVLAYSKPAISDISAARCNQDGTANRMGDYGKVTFSGVIAPLSNKNTAAYAVQYREVGAEIWSHAGSAAAGNYAPAGAYVVFAADKSKRYEVRVVATDAFESIGSAVRDLPAAYALLHHAKHLLSMGIGRLCDKANALQVGLKAYFDEDVEISGELKVGGKSICDLIYPVGSVYIAFNDTNPSTLFGGAWERIQEAFLWAVGSDGRDLGGRGGEMTHTLTVDEIPNHEHWVRQRGNTSRAYTQDCYAPGGSEDPYSSIIRADMSSGYAKPSVSWGGQLVAGEVISDDHNQPHNNMPPYIQVSMWRRTA